MKEIIARSKNLQQNMTLENLFSIICSNPDKVAARYLEGDEEKAITYAQYKEKAMAMAQYINGILPVESEGKFIALQLDTCPDWFSVFWGIIASGHQALLLDFALNDEMTAYMLGQAGAAAIIGGKKRTLPECYTQITLDEMKAAPAAPAFRPVFGTMVALCTSGTTSTSRIFVYNETAICNQVLNSELLYRSNKRIINDKPNRNLAFLPFHHIFGFMVCIQWIHFIGYENVYLRDRSPKTIQETARRFHVTHLLAVPLLANNLSVALNKKVAKEKRFKRAAFKSMKGTSIALQTVNPRLGLGLARKVMFRNVVSQLLGKDIKCIILGGSHTPAKYMRTLSALGYYVVSGFGMTETGITSVETGNNIIKRTSGSVGRPLSSAEYRVEPTGDDPNVGEMFIRGNTVHTGRLVDGKMLPPDLDADGWYRTGDVVRLKKGNRMYVEGRTKDIIINESGENVYPDEIESALGILDGAEQISVLGTPSLKDKNSQYEDITLIVNAGKNWQNDEALQPMLGRIKKVNAGLPTLKRLNRVLITNEQLPNANGIKIKRAALKKAIAENTIVFREVDLASAVIQEAQVKAAEIPAAPAGAQAEEIKKQVRLIYAETLDMDVSEIRDDAHFIDELGGDSLQVLGMSLKLEETMGILIPVEEYGNCTTVNDLTALLLKKQSGTEEKEENDGPVTPITRFEDSPEYIAFQKRQEDLLGSGMGNPYFVCHDSPLLDTSNMAGQRVLNFGSYNYVGMSGRPEVKEAAKHAIDLYGTSASGSRLLAGEKTLHQELEKEIADWKHTETALVLVGGHSTNVTCVGNFCGKGDLILYDAIAHNSVAQGCQLSLATCRPFPHNDYEALEGILRTQRHKYAKVLIIIEGAYSMDGDIAPVPKFVEIKKKYGCFLMVDEAHSACVIGKTGGGVDEYFGLDGKDIDIKMGTLSKGLGTCGGYLAGSHAIIDYMRYNLPGFVFSVGLSPALAAASLCAIRLLRNDPSIMQRMERNIKCFVEEAHKRNLNTCLAGETAIVPIMVGSDEDAFLLSNMLRSKGVFVPPAVYPAVPKGKARLRFCVISEHQPEQIVEALDALLVCAKEAGIDLPPMDA